MQSRHHMHRYEFPRKCQATSETHSACREASARQTRVGPVPQPCHQGLSRLFSTESAAHPRKNRQVLRSLPDDHRYVSHSPHSGQTVHMYYSRSACGHRKPQAGSDWAAQNGRIEGQSGRRRVKWFSVPSTMGCYQSLIAVVVHHRAWPGGARMTELLPSPSPTTKSPFPFLSRQPRKEGGTGECTGGHVVARQSSPTGAGPGVARGSTRCFMQWINAR